MIANIMTVYGKNHSAKPHTVRIIPHQAVATIEEVIIIKNLKHFAIG